MATSKIFSMFKSIRLGHMIYSQGGIQNASPLLLNARTAAGAVKSGAKGAKAAGQSVGKARRALSVETDPNKLVNFVCGSDYRTEEHREGDVPIKADSEYPEWVFTMDVKRPKPYAIEMEDKNSIEYWERVRTEHMWKQKRMFKKKLFRHKTDRK